MLHLRQENGEGCVFLSEKVLHLSERLYKI